MIEPTVCILEESSPVKIWTELGLEDNSKVLYTRLCKETGEETPWYPTRLQKSLWNLTANMRLATKKEVLDYVTNPCADNKTKTVVCIYCYTKVPDDFDFVPEWDDIEWDRQEKLHKPDCPWVKARAFVSEESIRNEDS